MENKNHPDVERSVGSVREKDISRLPDAQLLDEFTTYLFAEVDPATARERIEAEALRLPMGPGMRRMSKERVETEVATLKAEILKRLKKASKEK